MANKSNTWLSAIQGFLGGGIEGYKTGKTLQDMAAERALKKKQFELDVERNSSGQTVVGADGQVYQSSGISPEAKGRLLGNNSSSQSILPGAVNMGTGKLSFQKPTKPTEEVTNVTAEEFNADPEKYRHKKIKIGPTPKGASLPPEVQDAKQGLDEIRKIFLREGSISDSQAKLVKQYAGVLGTNTTTEEDQGLVAWANKLMGDTQHTMVPGKTQPTPTAPKNKILVTLKSTGQKGYIPASEFDPAIYSK